MPVLLMTGVAIPWLSVYKAPTCPAIEWDVDMRAVPVTERKGKRAGGKSLYRFYKSRYKEMS